MSQQNNNDLETIQSLSIPEMSQEQLTIAIVSGMVHRYLDPLTERYVYSKFRPLQAEPEPEFYLESSNWVQVNNNGGMNE